jgi:septal ring factor EnvC (AmiA/AmiB activator)
VVRRLAGPDAGRVPGDRDADDLGAAYRDAAAASSHPGQPVRHETARHETAQPETALQETVASLEQKLASATSRQRRLAEENTRLREQLRAAEQSLAEAQDRATAEALAGRFDSAEVLLLERLLSPLREQRRQPPEADAG